MNTIRVSVDDDDDELFVKIIIGLQSKGACFESTVEGDHFVIKITGT